MNCKIHYDREAVAYCKTCHAPICKSCNSRFDGACASCMKDTVKKWKKSIILQFGESILFFIIAIFLVSMRLGEEPITVETIITNVLCIVALTLFPFGWSAISKWLSFTESFVSPEGRVIAFMIKFVASMVLGWILGIPKVIEAVKEWKEISEYEKSIIR